MLILRPNDHAALLSFHDAVEAIEQAFRAWSEEPGLNLPRLIVNERIRLAVHLASVPFLDGAGLMAHTRHLGSSAPDRHHAASLVFDLETGGLDAILLGQILCGRPVGGVADLRTAATSAVAIKYLAREDAQTVGILGSGRQAQSHLAALAAVRLLRSAKVYSRSHEKRTSYAQKMTKALGIPVEAVDAAKDAVRDVDIVLVMTDTKEPVLFGEWLKPGQHVTSVMGSNTPLDSSGRPVRKPRRDLDDEALRRGDVIVINSRTQARQDFQGDVMVPIEAGVLTWERVHELGEVLTGKAAGRTDARQITLYKNNGGQGVADVALALLAAKKAREKGLGTEI